MHSTLSGTTKLGHKQINDSRVGELDVGFVWLSSCGRLARGGLCENMSGVRGAGESVAGFRRKASGSDRLVTTHKPSSARMNAMGSKISKGKAISSGIAAVRARTMCLPMEEDFPASCSSRKLCPRLDQPIAS